ncbi:MAG: ABC transporter ATP-binding protein/permease [Chromatiaceae bacterium]|nr:ABC transporter ATP-binding protein/permease [Chromatiaceae bacterium]
MREQPYQWRDLATMTLRHRREILLANVIAVLGALVSVPIPLLIPLLVDEVLLAQPGAAVQAMNRIFPASWQGPVLYILAVLFLTLALRLATAVLGVWQMRQFTAISKDVIYRIRRDLLLRLQRVSMAEYETLGSGKVASHLVTDLDAIDGFLGSATSKFLVAVLSIIGTAAVLLWMNWQLALFILFLNPLVVYVTTILGHRVKELKRRENAAYETFQEGLSETLDAIQQIRASNREHFYIDRTVRSAARIRDFSSSYTWKSDAGNRLSFLVFMYGFDIFRALSMLMVLFSDLTIGQMLAVFAYLWFMMGPVQEVLGIQYAYHSASAALNRINRLFDIRLEPTFPHMRNPFKGKRTVSVELDRVCFAYGAGPPVLDGVSFRIEPGEKIAFVGASGGGKTTLVQILLGLYPPGSGRVLFDGVPVQEIGMDLVRDNVATVLQHPALFNDTVRMNLTLGRKAAEDALWHALEIAQLRERVAALDQGLDTLVGRGGIRLSGGQRQRLAIARLVLSDPRVVILDEATSALDTETERQLHQALSTYLAGRTTIIIAHRLSAVRQADRVLVFEDGRIQEEGRHEELIVGAGLYAALYGRQAN